MASTDTQTRLTYEDYAAIDDGKRYELLDGELVEMSSPTYAHQVVLGAMFFALYLYLKTHPIGAVYFAPLDVTLDDENTFQPDLLYISNERRGMIKEARILGAPDLAVEILSPSTRQHDLGLKRETYRKHGVREYWVVSPESHTVQVFRFEENPERPVTILAGHDTLSSPLLPGLEVRLAEIFAAR